MSSLKSSKDEEEQGETARMSSKRRRIKDADVKHSSHDTSPLAKPVEATESLGNVKDTVSQLSPSKATENEESSPIKYGKNLVGSKVKVWWPEDETFYEGVIESFDSGEKKHTVYYTDGDEELLDLSRERWEFIVNYSVSDGDAEVEHSSPDTSSDAQRKKKKKGNANSKSSKRSKKISIQPWILGLEFPGDSGKAFGGMSKEDDKPESEMNVNNIEPRELGDKSQGHFAKPPSHLTKRDSQRSSAESKDNTPQSGNTLPQASSSPTVKESGKAPEKTSSSSKDVEGNNSIWPTEGTLHQANKSTLKRLSKMLNEGIHAGVTIITSDGSLKANKSILSTNSPVFRSIFQDDLREKVATVEMKEMTSESCNALLSFLYGSPNKEAFLRHRLDLLGAANKYEILDLKDACQQSLLEDINSGNVLERLQQAWLYKLDELKEGCFTYLMDSEKISVVGEVMNVFFKQADRGLLAEMFQVVLAVLKRS